MDSIDKKRFNVLDSFRGLSAIFVTIYHMNYINSITEMNFFKESHLFVEFFFILSGFVLTHGYNLKKDLKFSNFIINRTFRIMPLHIVMLMIIILMELIYFSLYKYGINFNRIPFTDTKLISDIMPNLFLIHSWFPYSIETWNQPSWSISIEYYIYIIFFLTLLIKENLKYILWFLISIFMFYLIFIRIETFLFVLRGLSSFFMGSLVYIFYYKVHSKIVVNKLYFSIIEVILITLLIIMVSSKMEHKSLLLSMLFSIQIFIFAFEKGFISYILKQKVFLYLGKISYSIYLTHTIIISLSVLLSLFLQKILGITLIEVVDSNKFINLGNIYINNFFIFIELYFIILISSFTYKHIEKRGQDIGKMINYNFNK